MYTHPLPSLRRGEKERNQYIDLKRECGTGGGEEREREINILKERENVEQVVGGGGEERKREYVYNLK